LNITEFFNDLTSKPRTPSGGVERKSDLDSQNSMSAMSMPAIGSPRLQTFGSASSVGSRKEGILKKRRENGWDGKRWVVIEDSQFMYYSSSRKPKWTDEPVTVLHLSSAVIKKSEKVKFAFEVHSAELLNGRKNTYGRLYFAASSEIELMEWMNFIRSQTEVVSSKSYALKRDSPIIYFDEERRLEFLNLTNKDGETALHALMKGAVKDTQDHTDLYNRSERPLMSSKVEQSRPPVDEINDVQDRIEILLWLVGNGSDIESEDALGLTPLLVAAKVGASTLAKVLVRLGAKTDVETHKDGEDLKKICSENMREGGCDEITNATNVAFDYSQMTAFVQRASRCTYVKLFISKVKLDSSKFAFDDAILQLSVYDGTTELVEKQQITPTWPMITDQHVFWGHTMHMNTPIENLAGQGAGTKIIIEILVKDEGKSERQSVVWAFIELSEKKLDTFTKDLPLYHAPVDKQAGSKNASLVDFDGNMTCELMIINSSLLEVQAAK
jgi:myosin-5